MERWKRVEGYDGYLISSEGRVFSEKRNKYLKTRIGSKGYTVVTIMKNGKATSVTVHRLMALAFIENPLNYPVVNHKDEDKTNCNLNNLEWCTQQYNSTYGSMQFVNKKPVVAFDDNGTIVLAFESATAAAEDLGVNVSNIINCCNHSGYYHKCKGYKWEYIENIRENQTQHV